MRSTALWSKVCGDVADGILHNRGIFLRFARLFFSANPDWAITCSLNVLPRNRGEMIARRLP
jgi:hypothetical protein